MKILRLSVCAAAILLLAQGVLAKPSAVIECTVGSTTIRVPYPSSFVDANLVPEAGEILQAHNTIDGRLDLRDFLAKGDARRFTSQGDLSIGRFASIQTLADDLDHVWTQEEFAAVKDAFRGLYQGSDHKKLLYAETANRIGFFELVDYSVEDRPLSLALSFNLILSNGKLLFLYVYSENASLEDQRYVRDVGQRWGEAVIESNPMAVVRLSQR
jgi:hypothetical protein